jgi:hypothetical protein
MRILLLAGAAALTFAAANIVPATSAHAARWCLSQQNVGGNTNCSFRSRRACMRAKTGNTDACTQAPRGRRHYR